MGQVTDHAYLSSGEKKGATVVSLVNAWNVELGEACNQSTLVSRCRLTLSFLLPAQLLKLESSILEDIFRLSIRRQKTTIIRQRQAEASSFHQSRHPLPLVASLVDNQQLCAARITHYAGCGVLNIGFLLDPADQAIVFGRGSKMPHSS